MNNIDPVTVSRATPSSDAYFSPGEDGMTVLEKQILRWLLPPKQYRRCIAAAKTLGVRVASDDAPIPVGEELIPTLNEALSHISVKKRDSTGKKSEVTNDE